MALPEVLSVKQVTENRFAVQKAAQQSFVRSDTERTDGGKWLASANLGPPPSSIVRYSFMQSIRDILFEQLLENIAEQQWWERNVDL
jgi:hypothetical protein